jgi:rSAM/selenodomain-associated transferase 1
MINIKSSRKILVFVKAPVKGQVKTRLSKELGDSFVLELYKQFVKDVVEKAIEVETTTLCFYPLEHKDKISGFLGHGFPMVVQTGDDIGERMANAFKEEFRSGTQSVILTGTDIPDISPEIFTEAFAALSKNDAVIAPSMDGGYYLIGFNAPFFNPDIFKNISWSTDTVFDDTIRIMKKQNLKYHVLPIWNDIDTFEDFSNLLKSLKNGKTSALNTWNWLTKNEKETLHNYTGFE